MDIPIDSDDEEEEVHHEKSTKNVE